MTLKQYLENKNTTSAFSASLSDFGGNITFSNSGKRGSVKEFTLGLGKISMQASLLEDQVEVLT